jgi:hypothetical protein
MSSTVYCCCNYSPVSIYWVFFACIPCVDGLYICILNFVFHLGHLLMQRKQGSFISDSRGWMGVEKFERAWSLEATTKSWIFVVSLINLVYDLFSFYECWFIRVV